jgi:MFS family permease
MNTMMFFMSMYPALSDLLHAKDATNISWHSDIIIAIFTVGWAIGSVFFGLLADRIGRANTMAFTIVVYAAAFGLGVLSTQWRISPFTVL